MNDRIRSTGHGGTMTTAALLLALATLASTSSSAHAQGQQRPPQAAPATSALYNQPPLDGLAVSMAYARMSGLNPDFRLYAERSGVYQAATVFDRPAVLAREVARLEGVFQTFDLDRVYSVRVGVPVLQYDPQRGGFPVGFGESSGLTLTDPGTSHPYSLAFRNADAVNLIPTADAAAARALAQANGFGMQSSTAGQAVLQMAFRLVDAPPALGGGRDTVRADVLVARLVSHSGAVIHDFGDVAPKDAAPTRDATGAVAVPVLKAGDVQGFHLGLSTSEAVALGSRGWKTQVGPDGLRIVAFFNGLASGSVSWARCGNLEYGSPDANAVFAGNLSPPRFSDCLAVRLDGDPGPDTNRLVVALASQQRLGGADAGKVLGALREKYGSPTYVRNNGSNLLWIGRDPARLYAGSIQVTADVHGEPRRESGEDTVLTVTVEPYVDPRPKAPAPSPAAVGPKL